MSGSIGNGRSVGQIAKLSGVTIRTLHHYEQIVLLKPSGRTDTGDRIYSDTDCDRLSRILYYRVLGFPLDAIGAMLDAGDADTVDHLERQHSLPRERLRRVGSMVAAIEREMEAQMRGYNLPTDEKPEVFGDFDPEQYEDEARVRSGGSDVSKWSQARASAYTKDDWKRYRGEADELTQRFVDAMGAGIEATSDEGLALAVKHRGQIGRWFYDCSYEIHSGLGSMYVDDPRFRQNIDKTAPGLAIYLRDAILANADHAG